MSSMRSASSRIRTCKALEIDQAAVEEIFEASGSGDDDTRSAA